MVKAISYPIVEGEKLVTKITDSLSNVNVREFLGDKLSPVLNTLKGTLGVLINSMWIYKFYILETLPAETFIINSFNFTLCCVIYFE